MQKTYTPVEIDAICTAMKMKHYKKCNEFFVITNIVSESTDLKKDIAFVVCKKIEESTPNIRYAYELDYFNLFFKPLE